MPGLEGYVSGEVHNLTYLENIGKNKTCSNDGKPGKVCVTQEFFLCFKTYMAMSNATPGEPVRYTV